MSKKARKTFYFKLLHIARILSMRNLSIAVKLFTIFGIIFVITILLSVITFTNYKKDKESSTLTTIESMNRQGINKIDNCLKDLDTITKFPLLRDDSSDSNFIRSFRQYNNGLITHLDFQRIFENLAFKMFSYKDFIHSVFIYNLDGESFNMFSGYKLFVSEYSPLQEKWFKESVNKFGSQIVIDTYQLPGYVNSYTEAPIHVFSVARSIIDVDNSETLGVILVNCKMDYLADICSEMEIVNGQKTLIIGENENIVYDRDTAALVNKLDASFLQFIGDKPSNTQNVDIKGIKYLISYDSSLLTGWKIVNIIPLDDLYRSINDNRNTTVLITSGLILVTVLFLVFTIFPLVISLKKLVILMRLIKKGDFNVKLRFDRKDEVGQVARTFNSMVKKINSLINEIYVDKIKQKDLELQMLQNQINPHFLYNTLDSIHMMAKINKDNQTSQMAVALGNILRYSISKKNMIVTVREEVEHLKDYVMLQLIRFDDIFDIKFDIDHELFDKHMIKLILQPIVENALYHGINMVESGGKIMILGYMKENNIIFEVIDNGIGMEESQVIKMDNYINDLDNSMDSIGLKNVHKRIQLHYGTEYGIKIFSKPGAGTKIQAVIPLAAESH